MDPALLTDIGWIVVACVAGLSARLVRLPPLVGYLAAGMALAAFGIEGSAVIDRIGQIGVALLLFIVGLDLRLRNLIQMEVLGAGGAHLLIWTGLVTGAGVLMGMTVEGALVVAVGLSVSSLVLAAKSLEAQHDLRAYHGRVVVGVSLLQTVVATAAIAAVGSQAPSPWALALLGAAALRPVLHLMLDRIGRGELLLLFGAALAATGAILFDAVGLSLELGALSAGALLAGHDRTDDLSGALGGLKDAFLPAFFLSVGLVGVPDGQGLLVVLGLIGLLAVKAALFYGVFVGVRLRARTAFLAALPLTTYSGFAIIVASAAVQSGVLPESMLTVLALAAAASYLLNAPLARRSANLWQSVSERLQVLQRSGRPRDAMPETLGRAQFVVVGMGRIGTAAYDYFADRMQCAAGIDEDPGRLAQHRSEGRRVIYGDARDATLWEDLDFDDVEAVVLALTDLDATLAAVRAIREAGFRGPVSSITTRPEAREALIAAGASAVYLSVEQVGHALAAHGLRRRRRTTPAAVTLGVGAEAASG